MILFMCSYFIHVVNQFEKKVIVIKHLKFYGPKEIQNKVFLGRIDFCEDIHSDQRIIMMSKQSGSTKYF